MPAINEYGLRVAEERDLQQLLEWRNSDRIRAVSYTDHIITWDEHQAWFNRSRESESMLTMVFEYQHVPAGYVGFRNIDVVNGTCVWSFYLGKTKTQLPRGSGTVLGYLGLEQAFEALNLRKVCGEVIAFNRVSKKFFLRYGFNEDGRLRQHVLKNGQYLDVVLYSLLVHEWRDSEKQRVARLIAGYDNTPA